MVDIIPKKSALSIAKFPELLELITGDNRWIDGTLKQIAYDRAPRGMKYNPSTHTLLIGAVEYNLNQIRTALQSYSLDTRLNEKIIKPSVINHIEWSGIKKKKTREMLLEDYIFRTKPNATTLQRKTILSELTQKVAGKEAGTGVVEMKDGVIINIKL